ncbi:PAS domain-containing protein [Paenibacillus oenotherae]|uniref:histidine kinase n=1 Tax=Paenibacillus oenotherae TaxID=1435645 RepID=A0ABS7DCT6_9BACL|nr:ATP-binding protein [Paenibacillus oenotherae]MBW7477757.1 PAS domain-containing protein [Paenibacillus oenotherae]
MYDIPPESIVKLSIRTLDDYSNRLPGTMVIVVDDRAHVVHCNIQFLKETGYSMPSMMNKPLRMLLNDGLTGSISADWLLRSLSDRVVEPMTVCLNKADGTILRVLVIRMLIETEAGVQTMLLLYNQEPAKNGNLMERFGKAMLTDEHIGVVLLQPDSSILDISPLACQVLGVCKSVVVNEPLSRFFTNAENEYALIRSALQYGETVRNYPITWLHEGKRSELLMDVGWLRWPDGSVEGAYIIFKDITNLRSLEEQVQRGDRLAMIGQIAAGAAHEIRNPLTAIRGFLQMFRKTMSDREMSKEVGYTDIMLSELDRINALVSEFLMLSKPRHVICDQVNIHTVLSGIMPMISSEATLHGVMVDWEIGDDLPLVTADQEMLKQVFLNICKNGIEAMSSGGRLTVKGRLERDREGRRIVIDIQDTGPGIPLHMLDKIFDPFVTTKSNGTGLGLSVCQRIIHEFDGVIRAVSRENGAQFTIVLPC